MDFFEKIAEDLKDAMRAKDKDKLNALRNMKSALIYEKTRTGAETIAEDVCLKVITSYRKKLQDSITQFDQGGRAELADEVRREDAVVASYLPKQLDPAALEQIIAAAMAQSGAKTVKDMGAVMKLVTPQTAGRADGKAVAETVRKLLGA